MLLFSFLNGRSFAHPANLGIFTILLILRSLSPCYARPRNHVSNDELLDDHYNRRGREPSRRLPNIGWNSVNYPQMPSKNRRFMIAPAMQASPGPMPYSADLYGYNFGLGELWMDETEMLGSLSSPRSLDNSPSVTSPTAPLFQLLHQLAASPEFAHSTGNIQQLTQQPSHVIISRQTTTNANSDQTCSCSQVPATTPAPAVSSPTSSSPIPDMIPFGIPGSGRSSFDTSPPFQPQFQPTLQPQLQPQFQQQSQPQLPAFSFQPRTSLPVSALQASTPMASPTIANDFISSPSIMPAIIVPQKQFEVYPYSGYGYSLATGIPSSLMGHGSGFSGRTNFAPVATTFATASAPMSSALSLGPMSLNPPGPSSALLIPIDSIPSNMAALTPSTFMPRSGLDLSTLSLPSDANSMIPMPSALPDNSLLMSQFPNFIRHSAFPSAATPSPSTTPMLSPRSGDVAIQSLPSTSSSSQMSPGSSGNSAGMNRDGATSGSFGEIISSEEFGGMSSGAGTSSATTIISMLPKSFFSFPQVSKLPASKLRRRKTYIYDQN